MRWRWRPRCAPPPTGWRRRFRPARPDGRVWRTARGCSPRRAGSSSQSGAPAWPWRGWPPPSPRWSGPPFPSGSWRRKAPGRAEPRSVHGGRPASAGCRPASRLRRRCRCGRALRVPPPGAGRLSGPHQRPRQRSPAPPAVPTAYRPAARHTAPRTSAPPHTTAGRWVLWCGSLCSWGFSFPEGAGCPLCSSIINPFLHKTQAFHE